MGKLKNMLQGNKLAKKLLELSVEKSDLYRLILKMYNILSYNSNKSFDEQSVLKALKNGDYETIYKDYLELVKSITPSTSEILAEIDETMFKTSTIKNEYKEIVDHCDIDTDEITVFNSLLLKDMYYYNAYLDAIKYCKDLKNKNKAMYKQLEDYFLIKKENK